MERKRWIRGSRPASFRLPRKTRPQTIYPTPAAAPNTRNDFSLMPR